jgi:ABC-type transport system involved in multi-copper enzyme maturation permease subunit
MVVRKLILKELFVNRWFIASAAVGVSLACAIAPLGETAFNVAALTWLTIVIAFGIMIALNGVMTERKENSLQFVLSLPLSIADYVRAKLIGLFLCFFIPWAVATLAAVALILLTEKVPDGLLPFTLSLCLYMLANFAVVLCGALYARSEALTSAVIVITNMAVSVYMFTVGAMPAIRGHLDSPTPVWNSTIVNVFLVELIVLVIALALPLATAARRRDFL